MLYVSQLHLSLSKDGDDEAPEMIGSMMSAAHAVRVAATVWAL